MKAGDKVVCIDDSDSPWSHNYVRPNGPPKKGTVYVVKALLLVGDELNGFRLPPQGGNGIQILGLPTIWIKRNVEWCFMANRFRLVSEVGHPPVAIEQPDPQEVAL